MDYRMEDLLDMNLLQNLMEKLNAIYSFPSAIIDNDGKILTSVAWQDICKKYHRTNPESEKECVKSDRFIVDHIQEADPVITYKCPHGLVDNAIPIIIDGKHLGNFFTGQFFLEKPDLEFFKNQAKKYDFDEKGYLEAVGNTPIWSEEKLSQYLDFAKEFIGLIAGVGLKNLKEIEINLALKKSEERNKAIIQSTSDWIWELDEEGKYCNCSEKVEQILGYTVDEIIGKTPFDLMTQEEIDRTLPIFNEIITSKGSIVDLENWNIHKDGHKVCLLTNGFPVFDDTGKIKGYIGVDKEITERKLEEEILTSERGRLNSILKGTNSGSWEWNIQTGETVCNERWAEIIGYTLEEISPVTVHTWTQFAHPDDLIDWSISLEKHFKGESDFYESETRMKHKNGEWIWVLDRGKVHTWSKDGKPLLMSGTHFDITRRKKAELALRKSEALLTEAEKVARIGSWETDLTTLNVIWSNETFRIFGIDPGSFNPTHAGFLSFVHPLDRDKVEEAFSRSLDKNTDNSIEHRIVTPDGIVKFVEERWQIFCDDQGVPLRAVGTCQDITVRKQAEEEIIRLNERISIATRSAQVGIWEWDLIPDKLIWDEQMYSLYGQKKENFNGDYEAWKNGIHPDDRVRCNQETNLALSGERDYDTEFRVVWPDKSLHFLKARAQIIKDQNGKPIRMVGVNYDITDRKKAEQELLKAKDRAEEGDRLKTAFLANMSHEIRTPMNGILGFAGLLKEQRLTGEEQQEYISIIEKSGARMLNIINDIIDISKIESGQMNLYISKTDINEQIEFTYNFFKQEAAHKGLQLFFKKSLPARDAIILTDREKVYAILINLVKNAIKFTSNGSVEVGYVLEATTRANGYGVEKRQNHKVIRNTLPLLTFYVKDTGIGIPKNRQKAIFDRFIQADIGDTRAFQGAGLGLSISKAYVQMLEGKIWVESEEGKGSVFYFTLPYHTEIKDNKSFFVVDSEKIEAPRSFGLKILIAEDDEISEMLIVRGVKGFGREILKVKSGVEAVMTCRNNPDIDLVLMDIKMPEMNGYQATREIRKFNKEVIIIAQTAFALIGDREKAIESGCNDYLTKPFDRDVIAEIVKKYF